MYPYERKGVPVHGVMLRNSLSKLVFCVVALVVVEFISAFYPVWWPVQNSADFHTRQTARIAVILWFIAVCCSLLQVKGWARAIYLCGAGAFLYHVLVAFDQIHHWSHTAAWEHVQEVSGFGHGIFVSYAFSLFWLVDAIWWQFWPWNYALRNRTMHWCIEIFMVFIIFNGTVVFEAGMIRWISLLGFLILGLLVWKYRTFTKATMMKDYA